MAEALVKGLLSSGEFGKVDISVSDISKDKLDYMSTEYGVYTTGDNKEIARRADLIILAVKPNHIVLVVDEIRTYITKNKM